MGAGLPSPWPPNLRQVAAAEDNDFKRRAQEMEEAALRRVPPGKRPITERWWWFFGVTATFWFRIAVWPLYPEHTDSENRFALLSLAVVVLGTPAFVRSRRREEQKRVAARAKALGGGLS